MTVQMGDEGKKVVATKSTLVATLPFTLSPPPALLHPSAAGRRATARPVEARFSSRESTTAAAAISASTPHAELANQSNQANQPEGKVRQSTQVDAASMKLGTTPSSQAKKGVLVYACTFYRDKSLSELSGKVDDFLLFHRFHVTSIAELFTSNNYLYCVDLDDDRQVRIWNDGETVPKFGHSYVFFGK